MRGRTTQKRVSSTRNDSACFLTSAVATTVLRSSPSATSVTRPMSTSLYLILVLPASRPSAVLNLMVTVGPRSMNAWTASQAPMRAATMGTIQTSCSEPRFFVFATASGRSRRSGMGVSSATAFLDRVLDRVPDQPRIEGLCGKHGEHHDGTEGQPTASSIRRPSSLPKRCWLATPSERKVRHEPHGCQPRTLRLSRMNAWVG